MNTTILLSPAYLAPIWYYSKVYRFPTIIEQYAHYNRQSYCNRCCIASANGCQTLSLPIEKSQTKQPLRDVRISTHNNWNILHWRTLVSAYKSTPFFDYYADNIAPIFEKPEPFLCDFILKLHIVILDSLELNSHLCLTKNYKETLGKNEQDYRETIHPKKNFDSDPEFESVPYYQVFEQKLGFIPNLSIIDLLFNMGPESRIILKNSYKEKNKQNK